MEQWSYVCKEEIGRSKLFCHVPHEMLHAASVNREVALNYGTL